MINIGSGIGIPFGSSIVRLPVCISGDAISWHKNLDNVVTEGSTTTINGLLAFDGNKYIGGGGAVDVTGSKSISFKFYITKESGYPITNDIGAILIECHNSESDGIGVRLFGSDILIDISGSEVTVYGGTYPLSGLSNQLLEGVIIKDTNNLISFSINGIEQISTGVPTKGIDGNFRIGNIDLTDAYIWDIFINDDPLGVNNITHYWKGRPSGNLDAAWVDQVGSINGIVYGSPVSFDLVVHTNQSEVVKDSIGTRTDDVYYGQYLDVTSGQINFYRTSGTFDYIDPSDGSLVKAVDIPVDGLYTVPVNGICDIGIYSSDAVIGVLSADASSSIKVDLTPVPDILGNKIITFYVYIKENFDNQAHLIRIPGEDTYGIEDELNVHLDNSSFTENIMSVTTNRQPSISNPNRGIIIDITDWFNKIFKVEISKGEGIINYVKFNDVTQSPSQSGSFYAGITTADISGTNGRYSYVWDVNINDEHFYKGHPEGNLDSAWVDQIGSIDGTVILTGLASTINFNDSSYTSFYPICETAGTVLHDVMENSIHISVDTPVWAESLYGTDYLNQQGFVTKTESDLLGYDWETTVNSSSVILDDNTLVPLRQ